MKSLQTIVTILLCTTLLVTACSTPATQMPTTVMEKTIPVSEEVASEIGELFGVPDQQGIFVNTLRGVEFKNLVVSSKYTEVQSRLAGKVFRIKGTVSNKCNGVIFMCLFAPEGEGGYWFKVAKKTNGGSIRIRKGFDLMSESLQIAGAPPDLQGSLLYFEGKVVDPSGTIEVVGYSMRHIGPSLSFLSKTGALTQELKEKAFVSAAENLRIGGIYQTDVNKGNFVLHRSSGKVLQVDFETAYRGSRKFSVENIATLYGKFNRSWGKGAAPAFTEEPLVLLERRVPGAYQNVSKLKTAELVLDETGKVLEGVAPIGQNGKLLLTAEEEASLSGLPAVIQTVKVGQGSTVRFLSWGKSMLTEMLSVTADLAFVWIGVSAVEDITNPLSSGLILKPQGSGKTVRIEGGNRFYEDGPLNAIANELYRAKYAPQREACRLGSPKNPKSEEEIEMCADDYASEFHPRPLLVKDFYGNQQTVPDMLVDVVTNNEIWTIIFFQYMTIITSTGDTSVLSPVAYLQSTDGNNWTLTKNIKNVDFMKHPTVGDKFFGIKDLWFSLEEPMKNDKGEYLLVIKQK